MTFSITSDIRGDRNKGLYIFRRLSLRTFFVKLLKFTLKRLGNFSELIERLHRSLIG